MIKKILIANRGEIACRIIRTIKKMKLKSVVVYSDADANSLHVQMADEAIYIGPSPANQSYLDVNKILDAVRTTGADAVHPGYGFLSENAGFAQSLQKNNINFIAPSVDSIKKMGDKIEAKKIAQAAGVSTIPGYMGIISDATEAVKIAKEIGFPVMIKATAGGGGKGMRIVRSEDEVEQAFESTSNEARNSFSDDRIFIEKYIESPRHIEIQLVADKHGNAVCLGERECSIQRHHQKVIEEAPSVFIDEETRQRMYAQVKSLAEQVQYFSAGTVEFIVDKSKNFYFLEMNTRLQVEHCVTELITGIDIVEQMIKIANGDKLPFSQDEIKLDGWAIESRVYSEDPMSGFLPSSGRLIKYVEPEGNNLRIDSGVYEGAEVSMFYDPMIAKLCSYGKNREEAIAHMQAGLGSYVIKGISHNISLLEAIISHPRFNSGDISTNFIAEEYPDGFFGSELTTERQKVFLSTALHVFLTDAKRAATITGQIPGRERQIGNRWVVSIDDEKFPIYTKSCKNGFDITYESQKISIRSSWVLGGNLLQGTVNDKAISVHIEPLAGGLKLHYEGRCVIAKVRTPRVAELAKFMPKNNGNINDPSLSAPISGKIVSVKVNEGEKVKKGQPIVIIEAMKMENVICADRDTIIEKIHVKANDNVASGQVIMEFDLNTS